jgi:hypothetical protein
MSITPAEMNATGLLRETLEQARVQTREQLGAAWQLHVARVEEQLRSGWRQHLDRLLDERFAELGAALTLDLEGALEAKLRAEVEAAIARERLTATRSITELLNQAARRIRQSEKQDEWAGALLDAAAPFTARCAVFVIHGATLRLEKASFDFGTVLEVPLEDAPAMAAASSSKDPLIVAYSVNELSTPVAEAFGVPASDRVYLFPLVSQGKTAALLYAEMERSQADPNALELVASLAAAVWEVRSATQGASLVAIQAAPVRTITPPAWADLPASEQEAHLRAQRFARVQVAEIRLYQSSAVKEGRAARALYRLLQDHIDRGRAAYQEQFLKDCPSMVDYFHVELVRTLANDESSLLGSDYPGPLV